MDRLFGKKPDEPGRDYTKFLRLERKDRHMEEIDRKWEQLKQWFEKRSNYNKCYFCSAWL
jgi:hypothetical protein